MFIHVDIQRRSRRSLCLRNTVTKGFLFSPAAAIIRPGLFNKFPGRSSESVSHCGPWDVTAMLCNWDRDVNMNVWPLRRAIISSVCYGEENQYGHHKGLAKRQARLFSKRQA